MCAEMGDEEEAVVAGVADEDKDDDEDEDGVRGGGAVLKVQREEDRLVKKMGDPRRPTEKEVEEHMLTHLLYRNWCSICVRAKGKDLDHRKEVGKEMEISEYGFDYCFPGNEFY